MLNDCCKSVVGASWVTYKKTKITKLIVDSEGVASEREIKPDLCYVVRDIVCNCCTGQPLDMLTKLIPSARLWKLCKLAGTIMHLNVEKCRFHERCAESPNVQHQSPSVGEVD